MGQGYQLCPTLNEGFPCPEVEAVVREPNPTQGLLSTRWVNREATSGCSGLRNG